MLPTIAVADGIGSYGAAECLEPLVLACQHPEIIEQLAKRRGPLESDFHAYAEPLETPAQIEIAACDGRHEKPIMMGAQSA